MQKRQSRLISRHLNSGQNQNIRINHEPFENGGKSQLLGDDTNDIHDEIKSRLSSRNAYYYSVRNLLPSLII
jgi:hypothetical protein